MKLIFGVLVLLALHATAMEKNDLLDPQKKNKRFSLKIVKKSFSDIFKKSSAKDAIVQDDYNFPSTTDKTTQAVSQNQPSSVRGRSQSMPANVPQNAPQQ